MPLHAQFLVIISSPSWKHLDMSFRGLNLQFPFIFMVTRGVAVCASTGCFEGRGAQPPPLAGDSLPPPPPQPAAARELLL